MAKIKEKLIEEYSQGYDAGYKNGYLDAILESSWKCGDCGNEYDYTVTSCPNTYLDKAHLGKHDE
jgi:hypothetical protein